jgi:hypothetical protein
MNDSRTRVSIEAIAPGQDQSDDQMAGRVVSLRHEKYLLLMKPALKDGIAISKTLASVMEDAWMLAMGYSICHYVVAASLSRNNTDAFVAFVRALVANDNFVENLDSCAGGADTISVEDRLASAPRRLDGRTSVCALPFRKDLFLVSGVIC